MGKKVNVVKYNKFASPSREVSAECLHPESSPFPSPTIRLQGHTMEPRLSGDIQDAMPDDVPIEQLAIQEEERSALTKTGVQFTEASGGE